MPVPIPKTLDQEVCDEINALIHASDRFRDYDNPEIQAILFKLEKLKKADARCAFVRRGAVAAICGDLDTALEQYRKASYLPDKDETDSEFWTSLQNVGDYRTAHELAVSLLEPRRGYFPKLWKKGFSCGCIKLVSDLFLEAKKTFGDLKEEDFGLVREAADIMKARGLEDSDVVNVLELMGKVQQGHRIMFAGKVGAEPKVVRPPDELPYLFLALPVDVDIAQLRAMNRDLSKLVANAIGHFPPGIVASFVKAPAKELRAAA